MKKDSKEIIKKLEEEIAEIRILSDGLRLMFPEVYQSYFEGSRPLTSHEILQHILAPRYSRDLMEGQVAHLRKENENLWRLARSLTEDPEISEETEPKPMI